MDTKRMFFIEELCDIEENIEVYDINKADAELLDSYVCFFEDMQNINQLFELLLFNLSQLNNFCTVYYNDTIIRKSDNDSVTSIEINGLLINIISAGKTLVEAVENFMKRQLDESEFVLFKTEILSKQYDDVFSYRFLYYLRNYSQHGFMPISQNLNGTFCFDLDQIIHTMHIKPNKAVQVSMDKVYVEMVEKMHVKPHIAFTYTLDCYTLAVMTIYYQYLRQIKDKTKSLIEEKDRILSQYPELIHKGNGILDGAVIYKIDGTICHTFSSKENAWNAYVEYKKQAKKELQYYESIHYKTPERKV